MLVLFYIKTWLSDYLVQDIINIIQYKYYKLNEPYDLMYKSVLKVLDDYFVYDKLNDKYYIKRYKIREYNGNYFKLSYKWYDYVYHDYNNKVIYDYITISKMVNDCIMIKVSSFYDVPAFKRLESRIMENTSYRKIKSKQNRIILCYN
jgi:hypothetical protein